MTSLPWLPIIIAGAIGYVAFACLVGRALRTAREWHDDGNRW